MAYGKKFHHVSKLFKDVATIRVERKKFLTDKKLWADFCILVYTIINTIPKDTPT